MKKNNMEKILAWLIWHTMQILTLCACLALLVIPCGMVETMTFASRNLLVVAVSVAWLVFYAVFIKWIEIR